MSNQNFKKVINMLAFIGLFLVAVALIVAQILSWIGVTASILNTIRFVGECIAYLVTAIYAFFYVRTKRNFWWWIAYTAAVVIIIVLLIFA